MGRGAPHLDRSSSVRGLRSRQTPRVPTTGIRLSAETRRTDTGRHGKREGQKVQTIRRRGGERKKRDARGWRKAGPGRPRGQASAPTSRSPHVDDFAVDGPLARPRCLWPARPHSVENKLDNPGPPGPPRPRLSESPQQLQELHMPCVERFRQNPGIPCLPLSCRVCRQHRTSSQT